MEKAVIKKTRGKALLRPSDIVCGILAIYIGISDTVVSPLIIFLFVAYSYLRSNKEACISVFFILLLALQKDILTAYFYALGFSLFFVLLYIVKILNRNLYQWIPFVIGLVLIPYAIRQFNITPKAMIEPMIGGILMYQTCSQYGWTQKRYALTESMYGAMLMSIALVLAASMPLYYTPILLFAYLLITIICTRESAAALLGILFLLPIHEEALFLVLGICMIFKDKKALCCFILILSYFFLPSTMFTYAYLGVAILSVLILRVEYIPLLYLETKETMLPYRGNDNLLRRQMQNYAGIFQSLAEYYEGIHQTGAELLLNMANALQYNAEEIQKIPLEGKRYEQLQKALEGYQFSVETLHIEESSDGSLQLHLEVGNLRRGEIHMTLQPLLETLLHRKLQVLEVQKKRFVRGFSILFADALPFDIEAYGDSIRNSYTGNGDSYSIFRFRQSMICMISDGMGNGENAARSSRLITSLFQRMIISGIPQDSAIRCINKLIQSDTYATLDVICINRSSGMAYISKSAACPTFLLRDEHLHEINGNALPVGIISAIEPDCFEVALQEGDEFLMISDGITRSEVSAWLSQRKKEDLKEDVAAFSDTLSRQRRKDDSTLIAIKVCKANAQVGA